MENKEKYSGRIAKTKEILEREHIDAYVIKTKEGCDQAVENIFGYAVVGEAYFVITKQVCYAVTSVIDAQDSEESEFFEQVMKYGNEGPMAHLLPLLSKLQAKTVALNVSKKNPKADGFTVGSYRQFMRQLGKETYNYVSSETFINEIF